MTTKARYFIPVSVTREQLDIIEKAREKAIKRISYASLLVLGAEEVLKNGKV